MSSKQILIATLALALSAGVATAQAPAAQAAPGPVSGAARVVPAGDIIATATAAGQFSTFLKAAEATNLTSLIRDNKNLTVFAPTDTAFAAMPAGELEKLMLPENKAQLQKLLTYHIVNARLESSRFKGAKGPAVTVAGVPVQLDGSGPTLKVNDADIVQADVAASNGIIHVINKVLTLGAAAAAGQAAAPASATTPAAPEPKRN